MQRPVSVTISQHTLSRAIGKLVLILIVGSLVGYSFALSEVADYEKGKTLTLEQYTADFDRHKAKLMESKGPMWVDITVAIALTVSLFGLYELFGGWLGRIVGWVFGRLPAARI